VADAVAFAAVAGILKEADLGSAGGEFADDAGGLVARAVVDHDNLSKPAAAADTSHYRLKGAQNARCLVVCRNNDAVLRIGHWPLCYLG